MIGQNLAWASGLPGHSLLAAEGTRTVWEFGRDGPQYLVIGAVAVLLIVAWIYRRDTRELPWVWRIWLLLLRAAVLGALLIIALDPQERTETRLVKPSRVVILLDTSLSMTHPAKTPPSDAPADFKGPPRSQAVIELIAKSGLLPLLQQSHEVRVVTFDSQAREQAVLPRAGTGGEIPVEPPAPPAVPGLGWPLPPLNLLLAIGFGAAGLLLVVGVVTARAGVSASTSLIIAACACGALTAVSGAWVDAELQDYKRRLDRYEAAQKAAAPVEDQAAAPIDWEAVLQPRGLETRLGEALLQTIRESAGDTLSGIVIVTDGGQNSGIDAGSARDAAVAAQVRLIPVGVGSTEPQPNLQIANVQAPTHVHKGDGFTISAYVKGEGLTGRPITVDLLVKAEGDAGPSSVIQSREVALLQDGVPLVVPFDYLPETPGRLAFDVRVRPNAPVRELTLDDNARSLPPIEVVERKTKVLVVAGGPMRDYVFVRNMLYRDKTIETDIWLQTASPGTAQESTNLLTEFPAREDLFQYDVFLAFDPKWESIPSEGIQALAEWVFKQAGGMIFVAGDVYTGRLAESRDTLKPIHDLLPVYLNPNTFELDLRSDDAAQPWPIEFTREGVESGFMQLADAPAQSAELWKEFPGVFRSYPTSGPKPGATVFAYFTDPKAVDENGKPILLATQFYGSGRTMFIGSAELWKLRSVDETHYDRIWINLLREVGQGRLSRGTNRGLLLTERETYPLGATVQVQAIVLNAQFRELVADALNLEVIDPNGRPVLPPVLLAGDKARPGQFRGAFAANLPGRYRLRLPIPESEEVATKDIQVTLPSLEFDHPALDAGLLQRLATVESGGKYLPIEEAAAALPALLPDQTVTKSQFDVPRELWDRQWVLYLLVGLLSLEWLTRKLLKLA